VDLVDSTGTELVASSVRGKHRLSLAVADGRATWPDVVTPGDAGNQQPDLWLFLGSSLALLVSRGNERVLENIYLNWWAVLGMNQ
jgi:hypothetical protein